MNRILRLHEITTEHSLLVGSKALNVARAGKVGLLVPAGFCVTTLAYEEYVVENGLQSKIEEIDSAPDADIEQLCTRLQSEFRSDRLSTRLCAELSVAYGQLSCAPVAVRSSASAEDLPSASFAGQQATLLNVRSEGGLLHALAQCWASLWSARAVHYRRQRGFGILAPVMSVLVQTMVDADAAGVAFTIDPLSGKEEVVIEAAWGLGEAVVSGQGDFDRYTADRGTGAESGPPAVGHKAWMHCLVIEGGVQERAVIPLKQDARVLSPAQVQQVAQAALTLERAFGCPQDVEWALAQGRLFVLQARPVTTRPGFFTDTPADPSITWTAAFLNERFPLPVSPLGWTVVQELLEELAFRAPLRYLGLRDVERLPLTRLYHGHPYVNLFVFQTLYKIFPERLLPEDAARYFPQGRTALRRQVRYPISALDPRFLVSMMRHFLREPSVWWPWSNYKEWAAFRERHERTSLELEAECDSLRRNGADEKILATIERAQALNAELLALHRWSLTHADLTFTLLRRIVGSSAGPNEGVRLCAQLVSGLPNASREADDALRELATKQDSPDFEPALAGFLARYGHRSFSLDILHPCFADDPGQVKRMLAGLRRDAGSPPARDTLEMYEQSRMTMRQLLGRGPLGRLRIGWFEHVLHLTRCYMPLREEQRFYWQKTLALLRRLLLLLGEHMAVRGVLDQPELVFFLTIDEVRAAVHAPMDARGWSALARRRQVEYNRLCSEFKATPDWSYPPFLCGDQPLDSAPPDGATQFHGRGTSPGLGRGPVVVLFSPAELTRLRRGDVLVARGVDPGWTPVFGLLGALVTEHGGQLSHAAVVAREYGLPMVAGIAGITRFLHDGDEVIVDGQAGSVTKLG